MLIPKVPSRKMWEEKVKGDKAPIARMSIFKDFSLELNAIN